MDDRLNVISVELQVDEQGKVWLNVDGRCVFRAGAAQSVTIDIPREQAVDRSNWIDFSHMVMVFPKNIMQPPDWKQDKAETSRLPRGDHHEY